jgi:hypothetical protein
VLLREGENSKKKERKAPTWLWEIGPGEEFYSDNGSSCHPQVPL